ncbi:RDD family protein [Thiomicrorhabdus hydrogeniphila]
MLSSAQNKETLAKNEGIKKLPSPFVRLAAQMIDALLSWVVGLVFILPPLIFTDLSVKEALVSILGLQEHSLYDFKIALVSYLYLFIIIGFWIKLNTTPGKMLLNIRIVDFKTKQPPSKKQYFLRGIGYVLAAIPFFLGYLWIFLDKNNRGWHDHLSGTQVLYQEKRC